MKRTVTIAVIILLALGFGYYLYTISAPGTTQSLPAETLSFNPDQKLTEPRPVDSQDRVMGNPAAKNTFLVYGDFQCPACKTYEATVKAALTQLQDTKVVFRHYPLFQIHKNAIVSAYAVEAAAAQGKFWEMHDKLYETQGEWSNLGNPIEKFVQYAEQIGVANVEQFRKDTQDKTYKPRIEKDYQEGIALGVQGTPTVYFNGRLMEDISLNGIKKAAEPLYVK